MVETNRTEESSLAGRSSPLGGRAGRVGSLAGRLRRTLGLALAVLLAACAGVPESAGPAPGGNRGEPAAALPQRFAVAAANPLAAAAGYQILQAGGSAVDAAVAVQMVLTLVEPQASGIGGGAFLLHADGRRVDAYDGRETAPAAADATLFLGDDGQPLPFHAGVVGGRSVGVPGVLAMLEMAHREHGKLPWRDLFQPAIRLAEDGFPVSPLLHAKLAEDPYLRADPYAAAYFYDAAGQPHAVGHVLRNPDLAAVLKAVAAGGSRAFYEGEIARAIVGAARAAPNPGRLAESDLVAYAAKRRHALCADWRRYRVCGFPPPSSGGIAVAQILGILERAEGGAPALADGLPAAGWLHAYSEAARLAFADRERYVGDPDFVAAPGGDWGNLLRPDYLAARARLIGAQSMRRAAPGDPVAAAMSGQPQGESAEFPATSHLSIIDAAGKAVAMTSSVEDSFGSRRMVLGFVLNNQLTDFSFAPTADGHLLANRVEAGKRPRSSMAPTLVFERESGALAMSAGSPGGAAIIHYTAKTLLGTLALGLTPQQAIDLPNFGSANGPTLLEAGRFPAATLERLRARGHEIREVGMNSGIQAIRRTPAGLVGGADRRREGAVRGE